MLCRCPIHLLPDLHLASGLEPFAQHVGHVLAEAGRFLDLTEGLLPPRVGLVIGLLTGECSRSGLEERVLAGKLLALAPEVTDLGRRVDRAAHLTLFALADSDRGLASLTPRVPVRQRDVDPFTGGGRSGRLLGLDCGVGSRGLRGGGCLGFGRGLWGGGLGRGR